VANYIVEITMFETQLFQLVLQGLDFLFGKRAVDVRGSLYGCPGQSGSAG